MAEDYETLLRKIAVDVAVIKTKVEAQEKREIELDHEKRISALEAVKNTQTGKEEKEKNIYGLLISVASIAIAVLALFKH